MPVERTIIEWQLEEDAREKLRIAVLMKWAEEGHGRAGAHQRYRYDVETLCNGTRIYLYRPAWKNKGCDFEVRCEDPILRDGGKLQGRPSHADIVTEFCAITETHPQLRQLIRASIERVWNCEDVNVVCTGLLSHLNDDVWRLRAERDLKIVKWLFIEQDITDWNTSGRAMLWQGIGEALDKMPAY
jgi:hypothetical protein